jgi:hypothetical protein
VRMQHNKWAIEEARRPPTNRWQIDAQSFS